MSNVLEILKLAQETELDRKAIYEQAAAEASNALSKSTFEALAKEEAEHYEFIKAYYDKQVAEAGWPSMAEVGMSAVDVAGTVQAIFADANAKLEKAVACTESCLDLVYEAAIAAEAESVAFYSDALAQADDPNAIAFFEALVKAEKLHLKLLTDTKDFLDDPSKWFFSEEMWSVEG